MDYEEIFDDIVDFSTPRYYESLKILLANNDWMPRFIDQNGKERIVIIEKINMKDERAIDAIHKARDKWMNTIQRAKQEIKKTDKKELEKLADNLLLKVLDPQLIQANLMTSEFSDGITADILTSCIEKYRKQNEFFDNKKVIDQLSHDAFRLIEPWLQAAVCGHCHNFELIVATYPKKDSNCSICERPLSICRIYGLEEGFEIHKKRNKDLSLFCKAYLSRNLPNESIIVSHKLMKTNENIPDGDIDVYIPSTKTGFESKLFVNLFPQKSQLDSAKGEIMKSFEKYFEHGIERMIALTNLSKSDSLDIEDYLRTKLKEKGITPKFLKVGHFSFEELIGILNEEIQFINKQNP